jgi:hypothetical protein
VTLDSSRGGPISASSRRLYLVFAPLESAAQTTRGKASPSSRLRCRCERPIERMVWATPFFADQVPKVVGAVRRSRSLSIHAELAIEAELRYAPTRTRGDMLRKAGHRRFDHRSVCLDVTDVSLLRDSPDGVGALASTQCSASRRNVMG